MPSDRTARMSGLIQREISNLLLRQVKDPRIRFVTITRVKLSADLRYANVFMCTHENDDAARQKVLKGLESAKSFIRRSLSQNLKLRYTPELVFKFDEALEEGERVLKLIDEVQRVSPEDDAPLIVT